eukprot:5087222-Pyramimonas_sp.AAC.2
MRGSKRAPECGPPVNQTSLAMRTFAQRVSSKSTRVHLLGRSSFAPEHMAGSCAFLSAALNESCEGARRRRLKPRRRCPLPWHAP